MKRTLPTFAFICTTLNSAFSYADTFTDYIVTGSDCTSDCDGAADSFRIAFNYDNTLHVISSVSEGSFTDAFGTYTGITHITNFVVTNQLGYGIQLQGFASNPSYLDLASQVPIYPHFMTEPSVTITIDPYVSNDWIGYNHLNISAIPEADEWAMVLLGMPLLGWVVRRKQSAMQIATA
ncbi:hypothetical protein [Methylomonas sp. AM2-LC]|uniref:hypothetical protein n=1 Tax=Methylomonas sp. AM2-LC TaxID=3153301 RepID=UPI0032655078